MMIYCRKLKKTQVKVCTSTLPAFVLLCMCGGVVYVYV
jgi:hypothetical protein